MTLDELIERLQDMRDGLGQGDIEVLVVHQPGYPRQETIRGVWMPDDEPSTCCDECGCTLDNDRCPASESSKKCNDGQHFVYIVADGHHHTASPYGPRRAFDEAF